MALPLIYTLTKSLQHMLPQSVVVSDNRCSVTVFNRRRYVTVHKNGDSSALVLASLPVGYHLTANSWPQLLVMTLD
jgi:hypothetical protein